MNKLILGLLLLTLIACPLLAARKALVIGNANYTDAPLRNPVNDANLVSAKLTQLGFTVTKITNANQKSMDKALSSFASGLTESDEAVFYYSGHGANVDGINYLIPVGKEIYDEEDLPYDGFNCNRAMDKLQRARISVMVLDACRDNPFRGVKSGSKGLASMQCKAGSQYIIFATEQGRTAADGSGKNSPFTESFVKYLGEPLKVEDMMRKVIAEVKDKTSDRQTPWALGSLVEEFYFACVTENVPTTTLQKETREQTLPQSTSHSMQAHTPPPVAQVYTPPPTPRGMVFVEGGSFLMGSDDGEDEEKPVHEVTVSSFWIGKYEVTQAEWKEVMGSNPSKRKGDRLPVQRVSWYNILKYCNLRSLIEGLTPCYTINSSTDPDDWGIRPKNSNDANWDSVICDFSANGYRLPTEAEWEYAARGGAKSRGYKFAGSNDLGTVAWYKSNSGFMVHEVGTQNANNLGIYDMSGNVWEWCWDWYYNSYYSSSQQDNPIGPGIGKYRLLRGGGWYSDATVCRVSYRYKGNPYSGGYYGYGFRVCRTAK